MKIKPLKNYQTTTVIEFISFLQSQSIDISTDGKKLLCEAPAGVLTSALRQEIAERKAEILKFLQQAGPVSSTILPSIQARPHSQQLPLSWAQERLWFLNQLEGSSATYNIPAALKITGKLAINVLEQTLSEIINRHEVLRTSFPTLNGIPTQVIHPDSTININLVDLQQNPEPERETILQQEVQQEATTPFDLEVAPLIRCKLWQLDASEYVLALTMHHIVSDGWSMGILIKELSRLYQGFAASEPSPLPELAIQYADFALWQRQWLSGKILENQLNYWKQQLEGAPELLQLPTDLPRPHVMSYRGSTEDFSLSSELTQKLQQLSRNSGSTLFMTLQAAFATLLYRYSGQSDLLIGSPIANRNRREIEPLIGFFVNTLVLRTRFDDHPSFSELLRQVRETTLKAYEHQDVPFEQVVEALQPQRSLSHAPLFQVMFILQNAPMGKLELPGLSLSQLNQHSTMAKFDLTLSMMETELGLVGTWEYNTDLFDGSTIKRMATHFQNLLSAIVENPQQVVEQLPLLSEGERHQLLVEWNDTANEYPTEKCIHQLFSEQVEKTPDAIAVVFDQKQLTYHQLNQRANQLAHHLQNLGVGPEVLVGICVERSIQMVVGLLGILKAGGAYVPLDPNYPEERLSYMLADSGVEVLLTQQSLLESFPQNQARVVCLDSDWPAIEQHSAVNLDVGVTSDNLAYVIYTSGSTGKPKGAMNTHQGIRNRLLWMQQSYQLTSRDRVVQKTPFSFDVSVWEFFWPLLTGARIVVALPEGHKDSTYLVNLISQQKITTIHFVPSMLQVFLQEPNLDSCSCLKRVFCSGEALPVELTQRFFSKLCCELHNLYGPTEAAIDVTFWQCQPQENVQIVPIGRPIANTQVYILDSHLQPVPIGVPGELYIGGDGLARGYLNRPKLTSEKFITNPFCSSNTERLYKTSDLARYLPDGNIEFIGRIDNQVKIRGFRIELGEIETVLSTHPQIQQTVVIAQENISGNKRLVAYYVSEKQSLTTNQVREFLKQKLPEYMVPNAFVTLDTLPLTPNGKVDRKSLPAPKGEITRVEEYVAPRTEIEEILTNIWQELLLIDKVSIHDNFFEIGGDSILSIQVVSRAKHSGIQITPQQIFLHQTIAELARVATTGVSINAQQGLVTGVAPLTPIQKRFFAQNKQQPHHYNQSVLLEIPNHLDPELIKTAIGKLLEHHDALRLRFSFGASEEQQYNHSTDHNVPFDLVDLSSTPEEEQPLTLSKIATDYQRSLNLEDGPIMQVVRFNLGQERSARLLIIIHHLAVDGVSWRIVLSDLETIYQQLTEQQPIQLSPKTTAFIDWAKKLNNYAQSEILLKELDYWLNQPWSNTTPLPHDYGHSQPENTVASAASVSGELSVEETTALLGSVNQAYNTQINDILLSGLVLSLAEWTGDSTVLIDLEGHGREELFADVDLSRTVGWFTTLFPVLLQVASLNQPAEVIKSIKEQLRAIPNRGIGYGMLRYLCQESTVNQQLQTIPTAEICFNYLGQFDQVQSQTGWKFASSSTGANQSQKQNRDHLLDASGLVVEGKLTINWTYSSNVHRRATVEKLANSYLKALRSIIEHCQLEEAFGYTPSDFPDAQLNQLELDELLAPIKTKNISEIYPLSPMQQGMLFHSLYAPNSGVYFEQMTFKLKGNLNVAALKESWQLVVDRYSTLRTFFVWENRPTPLQVVLKQVELPWSNLDWRELSATEQQQQLSEMLSTQRESGFQLNLAPLMSCTLIQLSEQTYQFIWNHHHLLMDGWCLPIIFKDVFSFYQAALTGKTYNSPTPRPYQDYITWLSEQDFEASSKFWRETLRGFSVPTPLVVDKIHYKNGQQNSDYQELELRLSPEVSGQLESVARQHYVTLSTLVQGAWALLLSRYSGDIDVVFGVTVSGRSTSLDGVESMVGLFINTLPLRLQVSPGDKLIDWWQQIQQLMSQLQTYCYTPLVDIQGMSEVPGGMPLFESILVFENYPVDRSLLNQESLLELQEIESFEQTNYPLTVLAIPGEQLIIRLSYDTVRFDEDTIRRMLGHLQTIFSAIVDNPQQVVEQLPLLSQEERHQLLVEWNDTASAYPKEKCIHQLFEEQVEKTPDAIAVVFEQEQLTYHQLNQRANQLAHHLQNLGVGPEVLVGICVERSVQMVVGLLGILKSGGAYVPLDPNYPPERLSYMLEDSGVKVLLTQQSLLESLPSHTAQMVCFDSDWDAIEQYSGENLDVGVHSNNLAYVIYTSGSTGQPKGVQIQHKALVNFIESMQQKPGLESTDIFLSVTTL
ncbi:MAG: amino acid adenylation domain-containing protein, partial [Moorea sp. SIO4A3]|nr:amino acid adenylation domain-containing protein [Moorena sp. SIO4A3]